MTQASTPGIGRTESAERGIAGPFASFDIPFEIARLQADPAYGREGHSGRTLAKYPDLRVVLETMKPERRLPIHETAERLALQVLSGQLRVWLRHGENCDLSEGSFAAIDAALVHELECLEECAFILTVAWPPVSDRADRGGAETSGRA